MAEGDAQGRGTGAKAEWVPSEERVGGIAEGKERRHHFKKSARRESIIGAGLETMKTDKKEIP